MDDRQVHLDIEGSKCFPMMKEQNENDQKEITGAVMDSGKDLIDNNESKGNELLDDAEEGHRQLPGSSACPQGVHQQQQSQPLGALIRWERFLPQRCLRVLLVENDDCTRQVVSALLRNCSYEVVAVANGQQAWRILDDPSNHFDLVLTEVVMPNLSGIGLLSKIMSHNTCKNIPVIMMSSHDSMSTVFKCLSKGAVDFLVKPVRKNELKNLWQHVWRRCHSSSASGSETGSQIQKTVGPPNAAEPENNTGSNDENEGESISLNDRDGSDNGSATQSSWTKRAVEVESPKQKIDGDTSHPCCSTIAQVNQPKLCAIKREWGPLSGSSERQTQKSFDQAMGKDLEIAVHGQKDFEVECRKEEDTEEDAQTESAIGDGENMLDEVAMKAADLIGAIAKQTTSENLQTQDNLNGAKQGNCIQMNNTAFLELSLKRCHQNVKEENKREDGHILRQSGGSAFTRYNTSGVLASHPARESFTATSKQPKGFGPHSFNLTSGSLETEKTGPMPTLARVSSSKGSGGGLSTPMLITNQLSQSSNNQDLGSSVVGPSEQDPTFSIQKPTKEESVPVVSMPYERIYQPSYYSHQGWGSEAQRHKESNNEQKQSKMRTTTQIHHHHHHVQHVHHHHHHHQSSQHKHTHEHHRQSHQHQNHSQCQQDEQTMNNIVPATVASLCGSSNVEGEGNTLDGNNGGPSGSNGNGNGSVSGSNNGSNGQNGSNGSNGQSSAAFTTPKGPNNGESNTAVVKGGGNSGSGSGVDQNRFAQREAVLTKFRQKRKERCFEKKVRYQSRKKLAEQRPRIRGQFVRQSAGDPASTGETD